MQPLKIGAAFSHTLLHSAVDWVERQRPPNTSAVVLLMRCIGSSTASIGKQARMTL